MFALFAHLSAVNVELVDVLVDVDDVDVVVVTNHVEDDVVLANVLDTVEVLVVVVVSHPLQVLAQCVIFATLLSHKPCN